MTYGDRGNQASAATSLIPEKKKQIESSKYREKMSAKVFYYCSYMYFCLLVP
jgi:hypothetical protein